MIIQKYKLNDELWEKQTLKSTFEVKTTSDVTPLKLLLFVPPNTWPCLLATTNYLQGTINRLVFLLKTPSWK